MDRMICGIYPTGQIVMTDTRNGIGSCSVLSSDAVASFIVTHITFAAFICLMEAVLTYCLYSSMLVLMSRSRSRPDRCRSYQPGCSDSASGSRQAGSTAANKNDPHNTSLDFHSQQGTASQRSGCRPHSCHINELHTGKNVFP